MYIVCNIKKIKSTIKNKKNMNNDRKFRERAEIMKELLLARIPTDVIAKIVGVSDSTICNDRVRVAEFYGIKIPSAAVNTLERNERFRLLLKAYLEVIFETHNRNNPLYQAAKLLIDFDRIENHVYAIESFFDGIQRPQFSLKDSMNQNYQHLIEDCLSIEHCHFLREFYNAIYSRVIPYEGINREQDLIELATKFCCNKDRSNINTLVIDNPKALVESLLSELNKVQATIIRGCYGLNCEKRTLNEIGSEQGLTRERVRQIREKVLRIIRNELSEKKHLIHSTARYERLENQYAEINERYKQYYEETEQKIFKLDIEVAKLKDFSKEIDESLEKCEYSRCIYFLIKPVLEVDFSIRILNCLYRDYKYILDVVDDWDNLMYIRNFGKKSLRAIEDILLANGVDRKKLTPKDTALARRIIQKKLEK